MLDNSQLSIDQTLGPELVIGIVAALGTDRELVCNAINKSLLSVNYKSEPIHIIKAVDEIPALRMEPEPLVDIRYRKRMDSGNQLRMITERGDALALLAIGAIREIRENITGDAKKPSPRQAYILWSLKHPDEVVALRRIYGPGFVLISVYSPRENRLNNLAGRIAESHHVFRKDQYREIAESLLARDEAEVDNKLGQNVSETFAMADTFISISDPTRLQVSISRFIELLFGNTFHTPTRDEYAMFHAKAAALRSASLARQVGAVIATNNGDIISVGTNEVPRAGGGLYWCDDTPDHRDFVMGFDTSDRMRRNLLADVLKRLQSGGWLSPEISTRDISDLVNEALDKRSPLSMSGAHFMNLIEFVRSVHAEMAALIDAARRGVSVKGSTLYTTTFPCHDCAKHIVAAGIERTIYIEPYPKSLTPELYPDSIAIDKPIVSADYVSFQPFVGVAPQRYMDLFSMVKRKDKEGNVEIWNGSRAMPRLAESSRSHSARLLGEEQEFKLFERQLVKSGLKDKEREVEEWISSDRVG